MFDLDAAVDGWLHDLIERQPNLADHADELVDHVRSRCEAAIDAGTNPETAFRQAVDELGDANILAEQYRSNTGRLAACRSALTDRDARPEMVAAAAWVVLSLAWATAMLTIDDSMNEMLFGWTITTFLPLTFFDAWFRRRKKTDPATLDG